MTFESQTRAIKLASKLFKEESLSDTTSIDNVPENKF